LIFNELSRYVQFLCNFNVPFDKANNLLIFLCDYYSMDKSKMHILLTELMSNQKNMARMFNDKETLYWSLMKRGERFRKFGYSNTATILGLTIKFIDSDKMLSKLVSLNKDLNEIFRDEVLKQTLLRADLRDLEVKRKDIWLQILRIDPVVSVSEYKHYKNQVAQFLSKNIEESIDVDVRRSFNHMNNLSHDNLSNILKTYAIINKDLDYCQGMNFMAGYLYLSIDC